MTDSAGATVTFAFDAATRALVRLAARIAAGTELDVRAALDETSDARTPEQWVEEVLLQSYLFAGFPRALNAMREWRRVAEGQGKGPGVVRSDEMQGRDLQALGEATCAKVYGKFYDKLRQNIAALHPELDEWMIIEGYGKVLSRPGLDLGRRELCIVAACVAAGQDRQLHSHLHGARHVGVSREVIAQAIDALAGAVAGEHLARARMLWKRVDSS